MDPEKKIVIMGALLVTAMILAVFTFAVIGITDAATRNIVITRLITIIIGSAVIGVIRRKTRKGVAQASANLLTPEERANRLGLISVFGAGSGRIRRAPAVLFGAIIFPLLILGVIIGQRQMYKYFHEHNQVVVGTITTCVKHHTKTSSYSCDYTYTLQDKIKTGSFSDSYGSYPVGRQVDIAVMDEKGTLGDTVDFIREFEGTTLMMLLMFFIPGEIYFIYKARKDIQFLSTQPADVRRRYYLLQLIPVIICVVGFIGYLVLALS